MTSNKISCSVLLLVLKLLLLLPLQLLIYITHSAHQGKQAMGRLTVVGLCVAAIAAAARPEHYLEYVTRSFVPPDDTVLADILNLTAFAKEAARLAEHNDKFMAELQATLGTLTVSKTAVDTAVATANTTKSLLEERIRYGKETAETAIISLSK